MYDKTCCLYKYLNKLLHFILENNINCFIKCQKLKDLYIFYQGYTTQIDRLQHFLFKYIIYNLSHAWHRNNKLTIYIVSISYNINKVLIQQICIKYLLLYFYYNIIRNCVSTVFLQYTIYNYLPILLVEKNPRLKK